jgi:hypothetical protein
MAGGRAPAPVIWLHAGVQLFGLFGALILGVAHHLLPRFTGRSVRPTALTPWLCHGLAVALALRAVAVLWPPAAAGGAALHAGVFAAFAVWVWRALDPPPLRLLRAQLTLSSVWLAAAAALEGGLRARGGGVPDAAGMQAVYAMALVGGVLGWVLGVLLRAGPMFVRDWRVPATLARATPWALALSVALSATAALAASGTVGTPGLVSPAGAARLARAGDVVAFVTLAAAAVTAGALRRAPRALPMLSRSAPEARIFRVAVVSALGGVALSLWALALGPDAPRGLTDAVRHLLAVGAIGAVVIAMTFRLIPVLEGRPLPWPALRGVALWTLAGAVTLRTAPILLGSHTVAPLLAASGALAWVAFVCAGVSLVGGRFASDGCGRASRADRR